MGCTGLIASGNTLYFTSYQYDANGPDSASLYRTTKSGGSEVLLYQEVGDRPGVYYFGKPVYVNSGSRYSSYAYFAANDYGVQSSLIKRVPLTGGTAVVLGYAPEYIGDADFVTDGSRLFWADRYGIRSMPIAGGAIQTLISFPNNAASPYQIALHAGSVYYTFGNQIRRVPKAGGTSSTLLAAPGYITDLYVHAPTGVAPVLFWGEAGGAVRSLNAWGFQYTHQEPTGRWPVSVGFDGTRVLWIDCDLEHFFCYVKTKGSGEAVTVAYEGSPANNLQWDASSMYWTNYDGSIKKYIH